MNLTFTFNGEPVHQSRPRFGHGRAYEDSRVTKFKASVRAIAQAAMAGSRRFGDLDNLSKAILDAVNGLAFTDDAQITRLVAEKFTDKKNPRVEVSIEPADAQ